MDTFGEQQSDASEAQIASPSPIAMLELQRVLDRYAAQQGEQGTNTWTPEAQEVLEAIEALLREQNLSYLSATEDRDPAKGFLLDVAGRMWVNFADLIGEICIVMGMRGSGKSNTVALILEALLRRGIPIAVVDPHGEYYSLRALPVSLLVIGIKGGAAQAPDLELAPEDLGVVAEFSVRNGISIILDLSGLKKKRRYDVLNVFFESLWTILPQVRRPYMAVLEEAHGYIPEQKGSPVEEIVSDLATEYRKFGLGMIIADQRPANVKKTPLTQARVRILQEVEYPLDVDRYKELVPSKAKQIERLLQTFLAGTALVKIHKRVDVLQIRQRETIHIGTTPGLESTPPIIEFARDETLIHLLREALEAAPPRLKDDGVAEVLSRRLQEALGREKDTNQLVERLQSENKLLREHMFLLIQRIQSYAPELLSEIGSQFPDLIGTEQINSGLLAMPAVLDIEQAHIKSVEVVLAEGVFQAQDTTQLVEQLRETQRLLELRTQELDKVQGEADLQRRQIERLTKAALSETSVSPDEHALPQVQDGSSDGQAQSGDRTSTPPFAKKKFTRLQQRLTALPQLHKDILQLLYEQERPLSAADIAAWLDYAEKTIQNSPPTALITMGIVGRERGERNTYYYTSQLRTYLAREFAGSDVEQLIQTLLG